jgi:hypothetical protein
MEITLAELKKMMIESVETKEKNLENLFIRNLKEMKNEINKNLGEMQNERTFTMN